MRPLLITLTIILIVIGFFVPLVWVLAVVSAVSAIASASDGQGVDTGERTSRVMAGKGDESVGLQISKSCPACLGKVSSYASKCQFCGEILEVTSD